MEPKVYPSREGTDGAGLSSKDLLCPNLGAGGYASRGPMEHITAEAIEAVPCIILEIVRSYAEEGTR